MATVKKVGDHEIEAGCIIEDGAFLVTVIVRAISPAGSVRSVGYVFNQNHATEFEATNAANQNGAARGDEPESPLGIGGPEVRLALARHMPLVFLDANVLKFAASELSVAAGRRSSTGAGRK